VSQYHSKWPSVNVAIEARPESQVIRAECQVCSMTRTAAARGVLVEEENRGKIAFFAGIDDCRFKRVVEPGDVLVTNSTTTAFNIVLPLLGAIVTDRGGLLSHAAIVAREYGMPAVVGTAIGIAMGRSAYWDAFFRDYVMLTLTTPGLVFALVCVMIFGLLDIGPIVAIVLTSIAFAGGVEQRPRHAEIANRLQLVHADLDLRTAQGNRSGNGTPPLAGWRCRLVRVSRSCSHYRHLSDEKRLV
jgi:phosphohistidine swiveling domain-containing protein